MMFPGRTSVLYVALCVATSAAWLGCSSGSGAPAAGAGGQGGQGQGAAGTSGSAGTTGAAGTAGAAGAAAGTGAAGSAGTAGGGGTSGTSGTAGAAGTGAAGASGNSGQAGAGAPADAGSATDGPAESAPAGAGCAAPGTICWDFEEGKLPAGWTPYRNEFATGSLVVDNTRPHRGMYALHAKDFSGNKEGQDGGPKHTMRYNLPAGFGPVLWGRAFIYMTPATPMSHAGFFNARYPRPGAPVTSAINTLDWYEVATSAGTYVSIWHPPEPPGTPEYVQISDTAGVVGSWACVEWLFDAQNGNAAEAAEPRVWVNGAELAWPMTLVAPTGAARPVHEKAQDFTVLESGIYLYQGLSTVTNWWIDDLAVGKQRIGCN